MAPDALVDARAAVDPGAELGAGVSIGPFAVVECGVVIGAGSRVEAHAIIRAGARLGEGNVVHPFAVIGGEPQDRRHVGASTGVLIGARNVFREHVTVHAGTSRGGAPTRIGDGGLFMAGAHVAHDAIVGDAVTFANGTLLGGHAIVGDHVVTGGHVAIAPFVEIGQRAFLAGGAMVERPIPPFVIAQGDRARVRALNRVGLQRTLVPEISRKALEIAFRALFLEAAPRAVAAAAIVNDDDPYVRELAGFILRVSASRS